MSEKEIRMKRREKKEQEKPKQTVQMKKVK
jgi:hypothetical protein